MVQYATAAQFSDVYCLPGIKDDQINTQLIRGSLRVNECLGGYFTTPFSSNNQPATDLAIDFAFLKFNIRTRNQSDTGEIERNIKDRLEKLNEGNLPMMTDEGKAINSDLRTDSQVWANTDGFKSTFDMRNPINQRVDPDLLNELWEEDSNR